MKLNNRNIIEELSHRLKEKFNGNVVDVILFGSRVYGKPRPESDYDILIILKDKADWVTEREISDICYDIDLKFNIITDTHIISKPELSQLRGKQPVFVNAVHNGLHTW